MIASTSKVMITDGELAITTPTKNNRQNKTNKVKTNKTTDLNQTDLSLNGSNPGLSAVSDSKPVPLYLPYDAAQHFSPLFRYRTFNDVVAALIYNSGSEGISRYEIGEKLGINAHNKLGNRRISEAISKVLKSFPEEVGQYQKMDGKFRMIKYYMKGTEAAPGGTKINELFEKFERLTGSKFPYKLGDAIKFPGKNLNTLRISDVNLKRMCHIMEQIVTEKVVVTRKRLDSYLIECENKEGYLFTADRKSILKCILALQRRGFINIMKVIVEVDITLHAIKEAIDVTNDTTQNSESKMEAKTADVDIFCIPEIISDDDQRILDAIETTRRLFHAEGKAFPHGHLRNDFKDPEGAKDILEKASNKSNSSRMKACNTNESTSGKNELDEEIQDQIQSIQLPTFSLVIEKSMIDEQVRKLDQEQHRRQYGSGMRNRSLLPEMTQNNIHLLAEGMALMKKSAGPYKKRKRPEGIAAKHEISQENLDSVKYDSEDADKPLVKKKKLPDEIDIFTIEQNQMFRSKFTPAERNLMIMLRAFSYFLNPTIRFWPDPFVFRDLMHEFAPASCSKTAVQLMAAGVRELQKPNRFDFYHSIVKILSSYPALLKIRSELATLNLKSESSKKNEFFVNAFRRAHRILFDECESLPRWNTSAEEFEEYFINNNLRLTEVAGKYIVPLRSRCPTNENDVRYCIAYNAVISTLLSRENLPDFGIRDCNSKQYSTGSSKTVEKGEHAVIARDDTSLFNQIDFSIFIKLLEHLRQDSLIFRERHIWQKFFDQNKEVLLPSSSNNARPMTPEGEAMTSCNQMPTTEKITSSAPNLITDNDNGEKGDCSRINESIEILPSTSITDNNDNASICFKNTDRNSNAEIDALNIASTSARKDELSFNEDSKETRTEASTGPPILTLKKQVVIGQNFRQSFTSHFHHNLSLITAEASGRFVSGETISSMENEGAGELLGLIEYLANDSLNIDIAVPSSLEELLVIDGGSADLNNATKQLRYLEESEFRLDRVTITPQSNKDFESAQSLDFKTHLKVEMFPATNLYKAWEQEPCNAPSDNPNSTRTKLEKFLHSAGVVGKSLSEIKEKLGISEDEATDEIRKAVHDFSIVPCGIDTKRYVTLHHAKPWILLVDPQATNADDKNECAQSSNAGFVPRPWTYSSGEINWNTVSWLAESVYAAIESQPGILLSDLLLKYAYVMQPAVIEQVLELLEHIGCCTIKMKPFAKRTKTSPFAEFSTLEKTRFVIPSYKGFERLGLFIRQLKNECKEKEDSTEMNVL